MIAVELDVRSLALFRILLGMYVLYDLYNRLALGPYDLAWYTSNGYLHPRDTPHGAPLHRFWFFRGSETTQLVTFVITAWLAVLFVTGTPLRGHSDNPTMVVVAGNNLIKLALWLSVTSYQNRNMHLHDGSDAFVRHLLFWCMFLPIHNVWTFGPSQGTPQTRPSTPYTVQTLAGTALAWQIAFMYWGTVANRTLDVYGWRQMHQSDWMPPGLSAVHYALSGDFAVRNHRLTQFVRHRPGLTRPMTASAMLVETLVPFLCLFDTNIHRRHWHALQLVCLHLGLLGLIRLPNWQLVGILVQSIWIPTRVWDAMFFLRPPQGPNLRDDPVAQSKKTDEPLVASPVGSHPRPQPRPRGWRWWWWWWRILSLTVQSFFAMYMVYDWCGSRGWINQIDQGDIGEGLRLTQHWVMYGTVSRHAHTVRLTGILRSREAKDGSGGTAQFDLLQYLSVGEIVTPPPREIFLDNMSDRYPSPRWERALAQWASRNDRHRGQLLCRKLCHLLRRTNFPPGNSSDGGSSGASDSSLSAIELRYDHAAILPPGSPARFDPTKPTLEAVSVTIPCR